MKDRTVIGVDLGGTKVLAAKIVGETLVKSHKVSVPNQGSQQAVIEAICHAIDDCMDSSVSAIGCGVPSVVDVDQGIVYDVQNIPSWKEVPLKSILEDRYEIPVHLNNDANCFALGESYFGKGKNYDSFLGLIIGTGMAAGIVINGQLYNGHNCGAGEFGMIPYLDHHYEHYCSGQFFEHIHQVSGQEIYDRAQKGEVKALAIYEEYGAHLGKAVCAILYALDPEIIVLGGSVSEAYPFFEKSLWKSIRTLAYHTIPDRLTIEVSTDVDIPVKGAAALCYNAKNQI